MTFLEETTKFSNFEVFFANMYVIHLKVSNYIDLKWSSGQSAPVWTGKPGFESQYDQFVTWWSLKLALDMIEYICVQIMINNIFLSKTSDKRFREFLVKLGKFLVNKGNI